MFLRLCFYFAVFSILGWMLEVSFQTVKRRRFINRGFCYGPVCPIYGFGVAAVYVCLSGLRSSWVALFLASVVLTSALELLTGFVMDRCFDTRWWDYSHCRFNFRGYICLRFSLVWGLLCTAIVRFLFPPLDFLYNLMPVPLTVATVSVFFAVLITDAVLATTAAFGVKRRLKVLDSLAEQLRRGSDAIGNKVYSGTVLLEEQYGILQEKTARLAARFVRAFPDMKSGKHAEQFERLKSRISQLKNMVRDKADALLKKKSDDMHEKKQ